MSHVIYVTSFTGNAYMILQHVHDFSELTASLESSVLFASLESSELSGSLGSSELTASLESSVLSASVESSDKLWERKYYT